MPRRRGSRAANSLATLVITLILLFLYYEFAHGKISNLAVSTIIPPAVLTQPAASPQSAQAPQWGKRLKSSGCEANNALPDTQCTPGDILPVTAAEICKSGYASSVRNVPESEKQQVYAEYGIASHTPGEYEVDHLVSLELGGSNDISNLWPEIAKPVPGFHEKDKVENYLHDQVCSGKMSIQDAQIQIATNWLAVYNQVNK